MINKLAIVTTHPIQYYAPVFRLLAKSCELKVFYTWGEDSQNKKFDPGFGKVIEWDIPLLDGYDYTFVKNISEKPGSNHFKGIINPTLNKDIENFNPKAVLVIGYAYDSHLKVLRHFKGRRKVWFRGDSTLLDETGGWKAILKKIYLKWVYHHVDTCFYVGTSNKAYFKKYGFKDEQLIFAPHAIDNDRFLLSRKNEADELRNNLGIGEDEVLILFAGKFEAKKNPEILLQAFIDLDLPKTHLLIVGNGVLEESLKLKVQSLKLKNVHFLDFQNQTQIPVVYQAADVFCLPSQGPGETWGLAINEAMASGNAILTTNKVGCAQDLVHHGENGFVFPSNDLPQLKLYLSKIINEGLIGEMKERSVMMIKDWSISNQVKAFIKELNG